MGRIICIVFLFCFLFNNCLRAEWQQVAALNRDIFYLSYDGVLLSFTKDWVYMLENDTFVKCCRVRGGTVGIYDVDAYKGKRFWATNIGLFQCNCGKSAKRIFLPPSKEVLSVAVGRWGILLGTKNAIYWVKGDGKGEKLLDTDEVRDLLVLPNGHTVFILTETGFYLFNFRTDKILFQEKITSSLHWLGTGNRSACFDKKIFFAYANKIYLYNLKRKELTLAFNYPGVVTSVVKVKKGVIVSGSSGPYLGLGVGQWKSIETGLLDKRLVALVSDGNSRVYATDGRNVFLWKYNEKNSNVKFSPVDDKLERIWQVLSWEPNIQILQERAMRYACVHPQKIQDWKNRLKKSALLPKITFGVDVDNNKSVSDSVAVASSGAENVGPDDKSIYKALNFGVSVQWNLSQLVWHPEEMNIDTRAKLTVELRDDILDQLNQLYFERRRYQIALLLNPPKTLSEAFKRLLRIDRLRADIDALTGGFLTKYLESNGHLGWERDFINKLFKKEKFKP